MKYIFDTDKWTVLCVCFIRVIIIKNKMTYYITNTYIQVLMLYFCLHVSVIICCLFPLSLPRPYVMSYVHYSVVVVSNEVYKLTNMPAHKCLSLEVSNLQFCKTALST